MRDKGDSSYEQLSINLDLFQEEFNWKEGDKVISVLTKKEYIVSEQLGNMVRVKEGQYGSFIMAKSDLEKIA